jgi:fatty-acyl-CoA synthase
MFTLADFVRLNERRWPDQTAVVDDRRRLTHGELSRRARALAHGLVELGVRRGDRVGVLAGNSVFSIEVLLGTALAGAVHVPFNWRWATEELLHGVNLVEPAVVLVADDFAGAFGQALSSGEVAGTPAVVHEGADYDRLLGGSAGSKDSWTPSGPVTSADPCCVLFTGGTTGQSKGVVLSHGAAVTNAVNELTDLGFGRHPDTTGLSVTPLFHSASLLCVFLPHYVAGGTNVVMPRFDEELWARVVEDERVTSTFLIPNMIRRLLASGVLDRPGVRSSLQQLHTGGGLLRMPDKQAVLDRLPELELVYRYGLTEAGPMLTRLRHSDILDPDLDGSIGQEYTFAEVEVRDPDSGEEQPCGEVGEIWARGPGLMTGYFRRPDATAEVVRDGWLRTGDLAVRDKRGYLYFRDRAKDMIKSGGENVYAAEIEQVLYTHPAVMECGVVGVPSLEWDEEVRAVVALRPGSTASGEDLADFLREHLAGYKIPKKFFFADPDAMPLNSSGKVVKAGLRDLAGW